MNKFQKGFAVVEVILIVVILAIIAFVAWRVIDVTGTVDEVQQKSNSSSTPIPDNDVPPANNSSDLDTLDKQLDETEVEDDTELELQEQSTF